MEMAMGMAMGREVVTAEILLVAGPTYLSMQNGYYVRVCLQGFI